MNTQPISNKTSKAIKNGLILLLISLSIYIIGYIALNGKGSGAGFEFTLIVIPIVYLLFIPGMIVVLSKVRRTYPLLTLIIGSITLVFDHFFSVTIQSGSLYPYYGIGALVSFVATLIGYPFVLIGFWLMIEGIIRSVARRIAHQPIQPATGRKALLISLGILLALLLSDGALIWWIYSSPECANYAGSIWGSFFSPCRGPFRY